MQLFPLMHDWTHLSWLFNMIHIQEEWPCEKETTLPCLWPKSFSDQSLWCQIPVLECRISQQTIDCQAKSKSLSQCLLVLLRSNSCSVDNPFRWKMVLLLVQVAIVIVVELFSAWSFWNCNALISHSGPETGWKLYVWLTPPLLVLVLARGWPVAFLSTAETKPFHLSKGKLWSFMLSLLQWCGCRWLTFLLILCLFVFSISCIKLMIAQDIMCINLISLGIDLDPRRIDFPIHWGVSHVLISQHSWCKGMLSVVHQLVYDIVYMFLKWNLDFVPDILSVEVAHQGGHDKDP